MLCQLEVCFFFVLLLAMFSTPPPSTESTYDYCRWGFHCRNKNCVSYLNLCDDINDCGDGSDEEGCAGNFA